MSEYTSVDDLLADDVVLEGEDVTLPNGKVVKVRGMTHYEYGLCAKNIDGDVNLLQIRFLRYAMVEPKLSEAQAEQWMKKSKNDVIGPVLDVIRRLSGLNDDADKSDVS